MEKRKNKNIKAERERNKRRIRVGGKELNLMRLNDSGTNVFWPFLIGWRDSQCSFSSIVFYTERKAGEGELVYLHWGKVREGRGGECLRGREESWKGEGEGEGRIKERKNGGKK